MEHLIFGTQSGTCLNNVETMLGIAYFKTSCGLKTEQHSLRSMSMDCLLLETMPESCVGHIRTMYDLAFSDLLCQHDKGLKSTKSLLYGTKSRPCLDYVLTKFGLALHPDQLGL